MIKKTTNIFQYLALLSIGFVILSCSSQKIIKQDSKTQSSSLLADTNKLQQEARYFFINGVNFQVQFRDAEAILEFQEALRFDKQASIYYALAKSYYNIYKRERAIENLNTALELDPNHLPSLDLISDIYYFSDINTAISYNQKALEIERSKERLYKQAILNENIDPEKSIKLYNELLYDDESNTILLKKLVDIYIYQENNDNALFLLFKLDKLEPSDTKNIDKIMGILLSQNRLDSSFNYIKSKRLQLSELEFEQIIYDFGLLLNNRKEKDSTINIDNYLNYANEEFKFNYSLSILGAWISSKHNKFYVNKFINNALKNTDSLSSTLNFAFSIYGLIKDTNNIFDLINKYSDIIENNSDLLLIASFSLSTFDKDSLSLDFLKKGLIIDSTNADIYSQMGYVYDKLGKIDMSDFSYIMALRYGPSHLNANNNYAYSLSIRDIKLDEALAMSQKVIDARVESSAYFDTYAWINYKLGKFDIALEYLLKAIELPEASAEVYEHLGLVYLSLNKIEDSVESFRKALEMEPNRKISRDKLEILKNK